MPFIGRDWRSPGEAWVKTESLGWQRMKTIESQLHPTCHQNPTCSWPPKTYYGQHMATNCNNSDRKPPNGDRVPSQYRNSITSGDASSSSSSGSASPSPTGSPEKNNHHFHSITISSPYGRYSCCAHHIGETGLFLKTASRPDLITDSCQPDSKTGCSVSYGKLKMRPNKSESDLANLPNQNSVDLTQQRTSYRANTISPSGLSTSPTDALGSRHSSSNILNSTPSPCEKNNKEFRSRENDNSSILTGNCCCNITGSPVWKEKTAPHCRISVRTREVAMYNTISEAFYRLDFCNAIRDIRRFNYICKLLHLLITENLTTLSGCATRVLFTMLEQVAWEVSTNKRNIHVLKNLLYELQQMIQKYYCWGRPIGSSILWQQHFDTIDRIRHIVDGIELSPQLSDDSQIKFSGLPQEVVHEILLRLSDYRDLINSAQASPVMRHLIDGPYIWRRLCKYHFTEQQLKMVCDNRKPMMFRKSESSHRVKYARTSSADGKTSFRNPIAHKLKGNGQRNGNPTRQQFAQTSARRGSCNRDEAALNQTTAPSSSSATSSRVTRAIEMFDKEGGSSRLTKVKKIDKPELEQATARAAHPLQPITNRTRNRVGKENNLAEPNRPDQDFDWEQVFHQLRKQFDLKEEYPDCLLLCRHCRCLFWKSIGHPCLKSDDTLERKQDCPHMELSQNNYLAAGNSQNGSAPVGVPAQIAYSRDQHLDRQPAGPSQDNDTQRRDCEPQHQSSRVSVAILSRSFDRNLVFNGVSSRNPTSDLPNNSAIRSAQATSRQSNRLTSGGNQPQSIRDPNRMPANVSNLAAALERRDGRAALGALNRRFDNSSNVNKGTSQVRRDELVPKHIAISPQAFLKFFSL